MTNLALKFRPKTLAEILGQKDLVALFAKFIEKQKLPHSVFFGPAGCGKTSFARAVAGDFGLDFYEFDGANFKLDEMRKIIAKYSGSLYKPLIFIDEIHRLSKTQQESLLLPLENAECILIGASTENPFFVLSSGIRSRSMLFEFKALSDDDLAPLLERVAKDLSVKFSKESKEYVLKMSAGDARAALNLIEFALLIDENCVNLNTLKTLKSNALNDGTSSKDTHYRLASSFIKSMRGSDIDAALYYLARLIEGGESADFIARRMVIFASEDIGNADTNALNVAVNTLIVVKNIGFPEARIPLAQCVVYLASATKSNSAYMGVDAALNFVRNHPPLPILPHLDNNNPAHKNYLYPHDFGGWIKQQYLAKPLKFYESKGYGDEVRLNALLKKRKNGEN